MLKWAQIKLAVNSRPVLLFFLVTLLSIPPSLLSDEWLYTVKPDDTLSSISERWLNNAQDWKKLQSLNKIQNPHQLIPNQQLRIPSNLLKKPNDLAIVKHMRGDITVKNIFGESRPVVVGMPLFEGDEISTKDSSNIQIEYKDGSTSLLQENSLLRIDKIFIIEKKQDIQLHLQQGVINNKVKNKKPSSRFNLTTPSAAASVRGTQFRIANDPRTQLFRAEVLGGSVAVSSQGVERVIEQGYGTLVKKGSSPSEPKKLLSAVDLSDLQKTFKDKPFFFRFREHQEALGYRVEISKGNTFNQLIFGQNINQPHLSLSELDNGNYVIRVFPYDIDGLGGHVSHHQFSVDVSPKAIPPDVPELTSPTNKVLLNKSDYVFRWSKSKKAHAYHFQLSSAEDFSQLLVNIYPFHYTHLSIPDRLPSGRYYWHVAALDDDNRSHSFSDSWSFRIPPHKPILAKVKLADDAIELDWSQGKSSLRYRVQVATDFNFSHLVFEKSITSTRHNLELEDAGEYYFRVTSVDTDGFIGKSSNVRHIRLSKQSFFTRRKLDNINPLTELSEF